MYTLTLCLMTAFALSYFTIPHIIAIARERKLCETPGERSSHTISTPALGGIGIFFGLMLSVMLWVPAVAFYRLQYTLCAIVLIFLTGLRDDFKPMQPANKLAMQAVAGIIIVWQGGVSLRSFCGLFGLQGMGSALVFALISLIFVLLVINAFNLIDGINGLAGSTGVLVAGTFGCWFYWAGHSEQALLAFALVGATLAFLRYNYTPAKTFMGDSGSLLIGTVCAVLAIQFINANEQLPQASSYKLVNGPAIALSIMILPVFDTLRVFITRLLRGQSPFRGDRRHIHHLLIDYGLPHVQATGLLLAANVLFITLALALNDLMEPHLLLGLLLGIAALLSCALHRAVARRRQHEFAL